MSADIKFYTDVQLEYDALGSTKIDPSCIYFLLDTTSIMKTISNTVVILKLILALSRQMI